MRVASDILALCKMPLRGYKNSQKSRAVHNGRGGGGIVASAKKTKRIFSNIVFEFVVLFKTKASVCMVCFFEGLRGNLLCSL